MLLMQIVMQRAHFEAKYGVDMQLNARAHAANKSIVGLESVETQLGMFDSLSPAEQETMVLKSNGPDSSSRVLMKIKDAWTTGDVAALDALLNEGLKDVPTHLREAGQRSERGVDSEDRTDGEDAATMRSIVVGAGHLVGKNGVGRDAARKGVHGRPDLASASGDARSRPLLTTRASDSCSHSSASSSSSSASRCD